MRSRRKDKDTAKAICEEYDENTLKVEGKQILFAKNCKANTCSEDNSCGLSVPEETDSQTLVCGDCGKQFSQEFHFKRHIREVHCPKLNLVCKECGKKCCSRGALYCHMKTHLPPVYECAECSRKFERKKTLALHWHRIHGDGTLPVSPKPLKHRAGCDKVLLKCRDCDKSYKSAAGLSRHRATIHLQKLPHVCTTCGKAFAQKSSLQRHQAVHTKVRTFQCGYCVGIFKDKWHLTQHERIHTGANPYTCLICGDTFRLNIQLHEHICKIHETSKRKCPECSHTCQTFGALAFHWKHKHASKWVQTHTSSSRRRSVNSNDNSPSLSVEWRNKHALNWANPKTRKKRERINIALLEAELLDLSSSTEPEDSMNSDSDDLEMCNNESTSQTGVLSQDTHGSSLSLHLSYSTNNSDDEAAEAYVSSTDTAKVEINEEEQPMRVSGGHCRTKAMGAPKAKKSMELDAISTISEVLNVKHKNTIGKRQVSRKRGTNKENKIGSEENTKFQKKKRKRSTSLDKLRSSILTKVLWERSISGLEHAEGQKIKTG